MGGRPREEGSGSRTPAEEDGRRDERLPPVVADPLHGVHDDGRHHGAYLANTNLASTGSPGSLIEPELQHCIHVSAQAQLMACSRHHCMVLQFLVRSVQLL